MAANERTEKATSRRRDKARDQGQFAYSQEVTGAFTLFACLIALFYTDGHAARFRSFMEQVLAVAAKPASDTGFSTADVTMLIRQSGIYFLTAVAPILAVAVAAALIGNFVQGLPQFASDGIGLKFERLNPIAGFSRLKTKISPLEWVKILALISISGYALWSTARMYHTEIAAIPAIPISASNELVLTVIRRIATWIGVTVGIMAVGDFFLQRYRFEESIKMTKAEVKEDQKSLEGNPTVKNKIKQMGRERARKRMMSRIKDADVIVTNPTHFAVALEYKPDKMGAPRVVAKGQGWVAQRIKALAREHDIPAVENVPLARALYRSVELDQEIPAELYKAVAEVLAFVFKVKKRR